MLCCAAVSDPAHGHPREDSQAGAVARGTAPSQTYTQLHHSHTQSFLMDLDVASSWPYTQVPRALHTVPSWT